MYIRHPAQRPVPSPLLVAQAAPSHSHQTPDLMEMHQEELESCSFMTGPTTHNVTLNKLPVTFLSFSFPTFKGHHTTN